MKRIISGVLSSLLALSIYAEDTIRIDQVRLSAPVPLRTAFTTDTVTLSGNKLDPTEILRNNGEIARRAGKDEHLAYYGSPLADNALNIMRFTIEATRFTNAKLSVSKIQHNTLYLDGETCNGELHLKPGRHEVTLMAYSPQNSIDTIALQVTGQDLSRVTINPSEQRKFDFDISVHGERYGDINISPSGRYVVTHYANTIHGGEVIWRTSLTDLVTNHTIYAGDYRRFHWLSCRDIIYYTRKSAEGLQLIYLDPLTMSERLVATGLPEGEFEISPDETFLIVSKDNKGPQPTGALKSLYDSDDRMLGWRDRKDPYIYDIQSGVLQRLTFGKESCWVNDIRPDSKRLLLSIRRHDATRSPMDHTDIYEMDLATGKVDTLLADAPWIVNCQYSPDGTQLVITGNGGAFDNIGNEVSPGQHAQDFFNTLFLFDIANRKATHLLPNFKPSVESVIWNSANGLLYLVCEDGYNRTLWVLNPNTLGRAHYNLPLTYISRYGLSRTKSPRLVFSGQTATSSRDAYITNLPAVKFFNPKNTKENTISFTYETNIVRGDTIAYFEQHVSTECKPFGEISTTSLYPGLRMPQAEEWSFTASRGDKIKGFFYRPADFDATKRYPMIVYYYGGCSPTGRYLEYPYPIPAMANMDYITLVIEPSGASGFGQEFAARHVNTWGEGSSDDIIEGVLQFCREHPYVNADKIGCIGASYGGFMTQYLLTRTDIFACAISHAGISNITSYWGGGFWGYSYGECAEYGSFPWNNPALFTQHSPLFNADNIHTPLLLLHGSADTNVPTNESQQLYNALRILGREVKYIIVDGENHVITDYQKRQQWSEAIYAWFAKHLQDAPEWWNYLEY